ncbi:MAG: hypothetical protein JWN44_2681 [Myxococcales bacterium]|nr:hypothetical protein [Myxococcales bacterium]
MNRRRRLWIARRYARRVVRTAHVRADAATQLVHRILDATERGAERLLDTIDRVLHTARSAMKRLGRWLAPVRRKRARKRRAAPPPAVPRRSRKRIDPPRARCVVDVGSKVKRKEKRKSASAHGGRQRLSTGVERVRRIDVSRELLSRRVDDERPAAFFWDFLVHLVFTNVFAGRRGHQEFLSQLHRQIVAGVRRTAVWIAQKGIGIVRAGTALASGLIGDLHHRLHSLKPLTKQVKPARARGNRSQSSNGRTSQKQEQRRAASKQAKRKRSSTKRSLRLPPEDASSISQTGDRVPRARRSHRSRRAAN